MRNKYHIIFNLFLSFFALISVQTQAQAQETQKLAPNNIPVPWYSQKITGCPYSHCSLASSLMVFDYFKGMTTDTQRTAQDAEKKLIEYQRNYFLKKRAPFRRRTSIGQGGYYSFEIDSLTRYYENMISAEHFQQKDYRGTNVVLNSASQLSYLNNFGENVRRVQLNGEAYFKVAHDEKHAFIVQVGDLEVKVLGTSFNVSAYEDAKDVTVVLLEGKVGVYAQKMSHIMKPGG